MTGGAQAVSDIGSLVGPLAFGAMIWLAGTKSAALGLLVAFTMTVIWVWAPARRPRRMLPAIAMKMGGKP